MTGRKAITVAGVLKEALQEFLTDNCPHLAASISYYFLLSLFPLILAAIAVFGFVMRSDEAEIRVTEAIAGFLPVAVEDIRFVVHDVIDK
jgi:membrane protein